MVGRHGRPDAPGNHERAKHRAQLAAHGDSHHRAHTGTQPQAFELKLGLSGKDRPDESPGDDDNRHRFRADELDLPQEQRKADRIAEQAPDNVEEQKDDLSRHLEHAKKPGSHLVGIAEHGAKLGAKWHSDKELVGKLMASSPHLRTGM
jgi:hypothetical protein